MLHISIKCDIFGAKLLFFVCFSVDVSVFLDGYHGDCAETFCVGDSVDAEGLVLIDVARHCRDTGIAVCRPGAMFSDIGEPNNILSLQSDPELIHPYTG